MNSDFLFVLFFLILNFLCFSLGYLVNIKEQPNPFYFLKTFQISTKDFYRQHYTRNSSDFFRINLESSLLIFACYHFCPDSSLAPHLIAIISIWGLINITYIFTIAYFFKRVPMLQADLSFISIGITIVKNKKYIIFILITATLILFYFIFYFLSDILLSAKIAAPTFYIILSIVAILGFKDLFNFRYLMLHHRSVISPTIFLIRNIRISKKYLNVLNFSASEIDSKNIYSDIFLSEKPEIFIFSIESLGSVVYKDDDIYKEIEKTLSRYEEIFKKEQIYFASSYSKAPQFAGGSWLSVGSLLYGYKIEHDTQYNAIFKIESKFRDYKSMIHYFKEQGYYASMITPLGGYEEHHVDWEKIKNVYPMDYFVKWSDLNYQGKSLEFMNASFNPPDQYSLWKGMEIIQNKSPKPKITIIQTLNSHCNWHSPIALESDFKKLDELESFETTKNTKKPRKTNYISAINYQLELVFDFISKNPDKIYIVFGDHQPPFITPDSMGFETPLYVFSTKKELIHAFKKEGFNDCLIKIDNSINHEGFYSLFMKAFLKNFSNHVEELPVLPNGILFEGKNNVQ